MLSFFFTLTIYWKSTLLSSLQIESNIVVSTILIMCIISTILNMRKLKFGGLKAFTWDHTLVVDISFLDCDKLKGTNNAITPGVWWDVKRGI